ncbi:MAG: 4-hydroxy-3-methylbut-2-enyl diphosphate reductase [Alphaproteobacteria bacterium]|nr:4-hydroxy-3-methylbut-2-enyl diphosphate reductase [Alphaproteobacteria bacterium]
MTKSKLKIVLAQPRGFCAGVDRAIEIVERALQKFGAPVYVRHEIVHNKYVLEDLKKKGAVFVKELDEVPENMPVIFSAHGVPKSVPEEARRRQMIYIDATCPLVSKVHHEAAAHHRNGQQIVLIGHAGHPEVVGTMGQLPPGAVILVEKKEDVAGIKINDAEKLSYITQTTLSVDDTKDIVAALKSRFPHIAAPKKEDICYATTNRQAAVRDIAPRVDALIVIGSKNSSNSNRLVEVARAYGCSRAFLADTAKEIDWESLKDIRTLGLTAGASAPEILVQEIIDTARAFFDVETETVTLTEENVVFNVPRLLAGG